MVALRKLCQDDIRIIYDWISDLELRKMTGTRGIPDRESHRKWFGSKINDDKNIIRIITYNGIPVGIIGTNDINYIDNNANIYLYIGNTSFRKKGIAYNAVCQIEEILKASYSCHKITATIRSYNIPSINLFKKSGFTCEGIQKEQVFYDGKYFDRLLFGKILT